MSLTTRTAKTCRVLALSLISFIRARPLCSSLVFLVVVVVVDFEPLRAATGAESLPAKKGASLFDREDVDFDSDCVVHVWSCLVLKLRVN